MPTIEVYLYLKIRLCIRIFQALLLETVLHSFAFLFCKITNIPKYFLILVMENKNCIIMKGYRYFLKKKTGTKMPKSKYHLLTFSVNAAPNLEALPGRSLGSPFTNGLQMTVGLECLFPITIGCSLQLNVNGSERSPKHPPGVR